MQWKKKDKSTCIYFHRCNLKDKFVTDSKIFWISTYCTGEKQSKCKLRNYQMCGCSAPENMLPNGSYLGA